jgi:glycosyltransferase involved in cell wall biosynthesis
MAEEFSNVKIMPALPRQDYLALLSACDCGIVATQRDTGVPTFPSKISDYFRAGIPAVASVEHSTDFGTFLTVHNAGIVVSAGDAEGLSKVVIEVFSNQMKIEKLRANGRQLIESRFDVALAAKQLLGIGC